jgi:hypothetical protein
VGEGRRKEETGNRKKETRSGKQEAGSIKQKRGSRKTRVKFVVGRQVLAKKRVGPRRGGGGGEKGAFRGYGL